MLKSVKDVKLNVKPVFFAMEHKYYYEGPCRMASGDALKPGFDAMVNGKIYKGFEAAIDNNLRNDDRFAVLDEAVIRGTDDWDNKEEWYAEALKDDHDVDFYLVNTAFPANTLIEEFASRTNKPLGANPFKMFGQTFWGSAIRHGSDVIISLDWPSLKNKLLCLRAEKALRTANILLAPRFAGKAIAGGTDSFDSLVEVTNKFGTHFRSINMHELIDYFQPLPEGGNYTTPGRVTPNITPEEIAECEREADDLIAGAEGVQVEKKFLVNSLKMHKVVQKMMDYYDCSGFTAPCPDMCSTRRLNEEQFTMCLTHSLNLEQGFGSACEYDVTSSLVMILEMALAGKAAFMGNTLPLPKFPDGTLNWADPKYETEIGGDDDNLYLTSHSTPCRCLHGFDHMDPYALRHFALDAGFGAVQRHDFEKDKGQRITLCRISSDLEDMFIASGEIVAGIAYDSDNCNGGLVFRVNDIEDFVQKHAMFGLHLPLVYGDYTKELAFIAKRLGLNPVLA